MHWYTPLFNSETCGIYREPFDSVERDASVYHSMSEEADKCESPQYIQIGRSGTIQCSFREDVFSVLWYGPVASFNDDVIIISKDSVKSGHSFISGDFDMYPNGTLIISNVTATHRGTFTVIKVDTPTSVASTFAVKVGILSPNFSFKPIIGNCDNDKGFCLMTSYKESEIVCYVIEAPIQLPLIWTVKTIEGDLNISSHFSVTNETDLFYTSRVTTRGLFMYSPLLTLLKCKADSPPGLLMTNESLLLIQNVNDSFIHSEPIKMYFEVDSRLSLKCTDLRITYLVWQVQKSLDQHFSNIISGILIRLNITYILDEDYKLDSSGSLLIEKVKTQHQGVYRCTGGDGLQDHVTTYDVIVFVYPDPPYPIVDGCNIQQHCVIVTQKEGSISCTLQEIHPQVKLDFREISTSAVHFYDKALTVKESRGAYDITLTAKYLFMDISQTRRSIECKAEGSPIHQFNLSTKFELILVHGVVASTDKSFPQQVRNYKKIAGASITFALIIAVFCVCCYMKVQGRRMEENDSRFDNRMEPISYEETPLMERYQTSGLLEKKNLFISQLKAKYQDLYNAVQPLPYIREEQYCVNRVFVDGGIVVLVEREIMENFETWEKIDTYQSILSDSRVNSERLIIEGEPGFGKSTLTLQLAYDWTNKVPSSYLRNIDIMILLRLRQMRRVTSIYRAIKQFLLPKQSPLSENDLRHIINSGFSLLIVLDGYDEYPDQDSKDSDFKLIITRKMFQQFKVILTTRSSHLHKKYPDLRKRLKLTGFDDLAQDQYIRKALASDDAKAAEKTKRKLQQNPVLRDLCHVPFFFVVFAHMAQGNDHLQNINSVTSFFRYIIACSHTHVKNKIRDGNVKTFDLLEAEHTKLDKLAFEGLQGMDRQVFWPKEYLCERLGQDFYDHYIRIGVFVEEEVLHLSDRIQYSTEVWFRHKLFCEWYAAYYFAEQASTNKPVSKPQTVDLLNYGALHQQGNISSINMDHADFQYIYLFACGLNPAAGEKIIEYMMSRKDSNKFAILCVLEQGLNQDYVLQSVKKLCSEKIVIDISDNLLLQKSTIHLLEIAEINKRIYLQVKISKFYTRHIINENLIVIQQAQQDMFALALVPPVWFVSIRRLLDTTSSLPPTSSATSYAI
ncbi:NLR family CARD domain-containing protein 4 [Holothuria leucospilota]|uniref:NLR family CARD domain-containing protein 4 n=1 Tax=Holothuria leucospilota TaxID=206669 RepID=A0A9Q1HLJ3_HOLLE|nr:NLR family CARD domain-containing protein 4 [Holothuria leucospilota]